MGAFLALIWPIAALSFAVKTWCVSGYLWCNVWLKWNWCAGCGKAFHRFTVRFPASFLKPVS
jgi:hypothetical protein